MDNVLSEQNTLELNEDKVDELLKVLQHSLDSLLGHGVVLARPERAHDTL